ncbi:hypothetical protein BH11GEM2_BH11GEM2_17370 [soil metagenome]
MMRARGLSMVAFAAAIGLSGEAGAQTFGYTGSIGSWTVATSGTYLLTAIGAQGGYGPADGSGNQGGRGAKMSGLFNFTAGDVFSYAVGQAGSAYAGNYNGGGGGGTFFVSASNNPLLVAGGGGGVRSYGTGDGADASITPYASLSSCTLASKATGVKSTDLGLGGKADCDSWGSAGAGFYSNGAVDRYPSAAMSWANGLAGGNGVWPGSSYCDSYGGFGGGGSGTGCGGGGGGGGYSGGDGGFYAGGGGSWNTGTAQDNVEGIGYGNGSLDIKLEAVSTPEPASMTLVLTGLGFVAGMARRRARKQAA